MAWLRRGAGTVTYRRLVVKDESGQEREIPLPAPGVRGISWFPDGERVLGFGFDQKNRVAAFEIVVESDEVRKLFQFEHGVQKAVLVENGRRIVFSAGRGGAIFIRDVQGGEERLIAANLAGGRGFDVSPDGSMVAFLEGSLSEVLTLKAKGLKPGAEVRELTRLPPGRSEALSWSSDGRRVFFASSGQGGRRPNSEWWSVPVEGGSPTSTGLKVPGFSHHSRISMHPDAKRVIYSQAWGRGEVWVAENLLPAATADTE